MKSLNIDFGSLQTLQNLGLFLPNGMTRSIDNPEKENFVLNYLGKEIHFKPTHESDFVIVLPGFYGLSNTGKQILPHLKPEFREQLYTWLKESYKIANYTLAEN